MKSKESWKGLKDIMERIRIIIEKINPDITQNGFKQFSVYLLYF